MSASAVPAMLILWFLTPYNGHAHNVAMREKVDLLFRQKRAHAGGVIEIVIWRVPAPVPPSEHSFKYRLVFARDGRRLVGYDNERGKGDHRHLGEKELRYTFVDDAALLDDFWRDVKEATK